MNDFINIISRPDIMDCEIDIQSDFQGCCITLVKNKKIVGEYYKCEWCDKWVEVDDMYQRDEHIFCSTNCYDEYITELIYEDQFYYDV